MDYLDDLSGDFIDFIPEFYPGYMKLYCYEPDFDLNDKVTITKISKEELEIQKKIIGLSPDKNILFKGWIMSDIFTYLYKEVELDSQDS